VAQVWWLNLIIDLATVSIIHVQNSKYKSKKSYDEKATGLFLWTEHM